MACVMTREGAEVSYKIPVIVEAVQGGFLASNDDLGVAAMGETADQALEHFRKALSGMIDEFGRGMLEPYKDLRFVEVD